MRRIVLGKKDGSGSIWRMNKEKLIFVFCSGLLLFVLSMPGTEKERSLEAAAVGSGGMENTDRSGTGRLLDGPADGPEKGELPGLSGGARAVSGGSGGSLYEKELEQRIAGLLDRVEGVGKADVSAYVEIDGIGQVIAEDIVRYFENEKNCAREEGRIRIDLEDE